MTRTEVRIPENVRLEEKICTASLFFSWFSPRFQSRFSALEPLIHNADMSFPSWTAAFRCLSLFIFRLLITNILLIDGTVTRCFWLPFLAPSSPVDHRIGSRSPLVFALVFLPLSILTPPIYPRHRYYPIFPLPGINSLPFCFIHRSNRFSSSIPLAPSKYLLLHFA